MLAPGLQGVYCFLFLLLMLPHPHAHSRHYFGGCTWAHSPTQSIPPKGPLFRWILADFGVDLGRRTLGSWTGDGGGHIMPFLSKWSLSLGAIQGAGRIRGQREKRRRGRSFWIVLVGFDHSQAIHVWNSDIPIPGGPVVPNLRYGEDGDTLMWVLRVQPYLLRRYLDP